MISWKFIYNPLKLYKTSDSSHLFKNLTDKLRNSDRPYAEKDITCGLRAHRVSVSAEKNSVSRIADSCQR